MADLGWVTFNGATFLGAEMTLSRGVQPSTCLLTTIPGPLDRIVGDLVFHYGATTLTFPGAAMLENSFRPSFGRDQYRWRVAVVDRRWKWRYPRIDGVYNERGADGTLRSATKKNVKELVELCLVALGESTYDTADLPTNVYPPVCWSRARAALEMQWLCDLVACCVILRASTNTVAIKKLNDALGAEIPVGAMPVTPPGIPWKQAVIPSMLRIQGNPTVVQSKLELEAVGLNSDGKIVPIDELTYIPGGGWEEEWPTVFDGVADADKHLAFDTVWRWYRPKSGWDGDGVTVNDASQIELLTHAAECFEDSNGVLRPIAPRVQGVFWPNCDRAQNTAADTIYTGKFKVRPELGLVEFDYPIISWDDDLVSPADIDIIAAYNVRKPDSDGYAVYTKDLAVSTAPIATEERILPHPELTKVKIVDEILGTAGDNLTELDAEASEYLSRNEASYDFSGAQDVFYNGLVNVDCSGAIAQVKYRVGDGTKMTTRVGLHTEFDHGVAGQQQRRSQERLAQIAERMSL